MNYSKTAKIFLPSHHACKRTPRTSRLLPLHRTLRGGRGDNTYRQFIPTPTAVSGS